MVGYGSKCDYCDFFDSLKCRPEGRHLDLSDDTDAEDAFYAG